MARKWLTLSQAAKILGVHPATLRNWADAGIIPSFRTAGGHRRFTREAIDSFLAVHSHGALVVSDRIHQPVVQQALQTARNRLPQARSGAAWYEKFDEKTRARKRQEGRQLFALALQYVTKPEEREHILTRARELGYRYGKDSVQYGVSLVDTLKAIMFFRQALLDTLEAGGDMQNGQTPASVRVTHGVEEFTMEVLYATVDGYERTLRNALVNQGAS